MTNIRKECKAEIIKLVQPTGDAEKDRMHLRHARKALTYAGYARLNEVPDHKLDELLRELRKPVVY